MKSVIRHARRAAVLLEGDDLSDEQLLDAFVTRRDEAAFEGLVRRYGALVMGVCRRVLGNFHDSQDAFQATFLVLVHKAESIRASALGPWLYGVAYRTAKKARTMSARRRARERKVASSEEARTEDAHRDLCEVLDRELSRLPEKLRTALVMCELEGRPRREVAQLLGVPEGTLSSRLAAGRKLLARRLERYGLPGSMGILTTLLTSETASAVPHGTVIATVRLAMLAGEGKQAATGVVAALTKGVLMTMFLEKLRTGILVLLTAILGVSIGTGMYGAPAQEPTEKKTQGKKPAAQKVKAVDLLPASPFMPLPSVVSLDQEGRVEIKRRWTHTDMRITPAGKQEVTVTPAEIRTVGSHPLADVQFLDIEGNKLEPATVRRLLQSERLALVFPEVANMPKPDPLMLRLFKEDLLVVVVPLDPQPFHLPAGAPPGAAVPPGRVPPSGPVPPPPAPKPSDKK